MSNVTNLNANEINKLANEVTEAAVNSLIKTDRSSFTATQKGGMTGALVGAGIGGVVGAAVGTVGGFVWQHKGKVAIAAAAVAAFVYREEITNFASGVISGESAAGDAFM